MFRNRAILQRRVESKRNGASRVFVLDYAASFFVKLFGKGKARTTPYGTNDRRRFASVVSTTIRLKPCARKIELTTTARIKYIGFFFLRGVTSAVAVRAIIIIRNTSGEHDIFRPARRETK